MWNPIYVNKPWDSDILICKHSTTSRNYQHTNISKHEKKWLHNQDILIHQLSTTSGITSILANLSVKPYVPYIDTILNYTHIQVLHKFGEYKHTGISKHKNQWPHSLIIQVYKYSITLENTSIHAHPNMKINDIITWLYMHTNTLLLWRV